MTLLYPIFLNIERKNCLIVGGGSVALRKVKSLLSCGATVEVISPVVREEIRQFAEENRILLKIRGFEDGDEEGRFLIFAATGDRKLNQHIAELCREKTVWLNAVDDPENCDFYVPAILRRGDVCAAVSTSGDSPLLAAHLRDKVADVLPEEIGELAGILGAIRPQVTASAKSHKEKKALYEALLQEELLELLQEGKKDEVRERIEQCISSFVD